MEKGEIAQDEQFHLFPRCFLCNLYLKILKKTQFNCRLQRLLIWEDLKMPIMEWVNLFPNDKLWTLPNWKSLRTTIFKVDENGKKFTKRVENTVGKGEIARDEQFLLFPQCFQKASTADT